MRDTNENIKTIRNRLESLIIGCRCATGCTTNRCSCRKNCCNTTERDHDVDDIMDFVFQDEIIDFEIESEDDIIEDMDLL